MECNLYNPMKTLQEIYGLDLWKEIGNGILGRQRDDMRRKILRQVEEGRQGAVV
jgi:hypothetical protein